MIDELDFSLPVLNISENKFDENISVYPNPSSGLIDINFKSLKNISLKVFNIIGEVVYQKENIIETTHHFELNQPKGAYIIQVSSEGKQQHFKLIKK